MTPPSNEGHSSEDWVGRLTPSDVHHVLFTRAGLGRRGYDEVEVDVFLERVQQELTRLIDEKAALRDEVARLKGELARAGSRTQAPAEHESTTPERAREQAVRLLAAAQQTADVYVADAERYSQRLIRDAQENAHAMLKEAEEAARRMVEEAVRSARKEVSRTTGGDLTGALPSSQHELQQPITQFEPSGHVLRMQLRSYLEALLRDVDGEWARAEPGVVGRAPTALPRGTSQEGVPGSAAAARFEAAVSLPDEARARAVEPTSEPPAAAGPEPEGETDREGAPEPEREKAPEPQRERTPEPEGEEALEPQRERTPELEREEALERERERTPEPELEATPAGAPEHAGAPEPEREESPESERERQVPASERTPEEVPEEDVVTDAPSTGGRKSRTRKRTTVKLHSR